MRTQREIASLAQMACILEVCADKPGNVSPHNNFSDVSLVDFLLSAVAIGPALEQAAHLPVGAVVHQAIEDTKRFVKSNTNLGMVLLLVPLVKASHGAEEINAVRGKLRTILSRLSVDDARFAYRAIRLAKPGGMGRVPESDISEEPGISLLQAMILAQERDSIAREYATDFAITFEIGYPALKHAMSKGAEFPRAIAHAYLTILSRIPDTLIVRKMGSATARKISLQADAILNRGGIFTPEGQAAIRELDQQLRDPQHSLNPGTTADLTTAAIFLALQEFEI